MMVRKAPNILGLTEKNMETKLAWLIGKLDLDDDMVRGLLKVSYPLRFYALLNVFAVVLSLFDCWCCLGCVSVRLL